MSQNIFRRTLREIQGGSESEPSPNPKVSDAQNQTEESLVAGYQSTRSPFDADYQKPKRKPAKKQLTNEQRLDNVIAHESADPWAKIKWSSEARDEKAKARFLKEQEKANGKK